MGWHWFFHFYNYDISDSESCLLIYLFFVLIFACMIFLMFASLFNCCLIKWLNVYLFVCLFEFHLLEMSNPEGFDSLNVPCVPSPYFPLLQSMSAALHEFYHWFFSSGTCTALIHWLVPWSQHQRPVRIRHTGYHHRFRRPAWSLLDGYQLCQDRQPVGF